MGASPVLRSMQKRLQVSELGIYPTPLDYGGVPCSSFNAETLHVSELGTYPTPLDYGGGPCSSFNAETFTG